MFNLFSKKAMNEAVAKAFQARFEEQEEWIIDCLSKNDAAFIWAIDENLKPVFPYFKEELEFQLGCNNGTGEFFFLHFGKKELARDGEILGTMMSPKIASRWKLILEE